MSQLVEVLEEHPLPFIAMGVLFAVGVGLGLAGMVMARKRCAASRALGWLAIILATMCDAVGVMTMFAAEAAEPSVGALIRGMTEGDLDAVQAQAQVEAHYCLATGVMLGIIPFVAGVLALARSRTYAAQAAEEKESATGLERP